MSLKSEQDEDYLYREIASGGTIPRPELPELSLDLFQLRNLLQGLSRYLITISRELEVLKREVNELKEIDEYFKSILSKTFPLEDIKDFIKREQIIARLGRELHSKYYGKTVAISYTGEILMAEDDELALLKKLKKSNIDPTKVFIYRVETE